jgi:pimeloyl-ACP methyl ester carboxylesterase
VALGVAFLVLIAGTITYYGVKSVATKVSIDQRQNQLAPFYVPPTGWQSKPVGALLRTASVGGVPDGGVGWRILYVTQKADGTKTVSSGLVFAPGPDAPAAPAQGRTVIAWAHPTVGLGDACAPSRSADVEKDVQGLGNFLTSGWVVAATDYAGLGTPGTEQYLVGGAEAQDIYNSVRAARQIPEAHAGTTLALWGHSQGGQSALWAADDRSYAPEFNVIGVAVAAPAAELSILFSHQWNSLVGSLIGSEVLLAYPDTYKGLTLSGVTNRSTAKVSTLANKCVSAAGLDLLVSQKLGGSPLLSKDPVTVPSWSTAIAANVPAPPTIPTLLIQGLDDPVVLPGSNAAFVNRACAAGVSIDADFIGALGHVKAGIAGAPLAYTWFQQRLVGVPVTSTCGTTLPVAALGLAR